MALMMSANVQKKKFYALNMFGVVDVQKYLAYFSRLPEAAPQYGGRMVAFGRFRDNVAGDLAPRQVLFLVEWESEEAFNSFRDDPDLGRPASAAGGRDGVLCQAPFSGL
ncbi:DUF1330 domain-containing protein [Streptomyces sp. NPDC102270]|uniref:DUF1330 domain-containing protein n=1 Tax=Streptomyces sp. NPDC102270 TaxID=3366150 RepID=UPI003811DCC8